MKAEVLGLSNRFDAALATYDRAIALDRNHSAAYVGRARNLNLIGRAAEALAPVERAIRLSPRDPDLYVWYFVLCHVNTHLARDAQAIEWCLKSLATGKAYYFAYVDLASAHARRGQHAEAAAAVAELLKLRPGFTVQARIRLAPALRLYGRPARPVSHARWEPITGLLRARPQGLLRRGRNRPAPGETSPGSPAPPLLIEALRTFRWCDVFPTPWNCPRNTRSLIGSPSVPVLTNLARPSGRGLLQPETHGLAYNLGNVMLRDLPHGRGCGVGTDVRRTPTVDRSRGPPPAPA